MGFCLMFLSTYRPQSEIDAELAAFKRAARRVYRTKRSTHAFLLKHGFITKGGKLTKRYQS